MFSIRVLLHVVPGALRADDILTILGRSELRKKQLSDKSFTWINPFPTMETLHWLQKKHSLCQARVSKATNFVLPRPPLPGEICKYYYYMSGCDYLVWDLCDGEWDLSEFNLQKMCRCLCNILKWSKQSTFDTNNMTDLLLVWSRHCTS